MGSLVTNIDENTKDAVEAVDILLENDAELNERIDQKIGNAELEAAVDLKADASDVSNVDNTSDADKPLSTAAQSAFAGKAPLVHTHDAVELKAGYESNSNTNAYTDSEKDKLAGLESSKFLGLYFSVAALELAHSAPLAGAYAHVDSGVGSPTVVYIWDVNDDAWRKQAGDIAAETAASVKQKYEANADTNAFSDAEKAKVENLPGDTSQALNQKADASDVSNVDNTSDADKPLSVAVVSALAGKAPLVHTHDAVELKAGYESNNNTNAFTDLEKAKLAGLEASKFLGLYFSVAALTLAHPTPAAGAYAHVDPGVGSPTVVYLWDVNDGSWRKQEGEVATETAASVKQKYEENPDTNAFSDAEKAKVDNLPGDTNQALTQKANAADVSNVDNTSDQDKPVSTAVAAALSGKSDSGHAHSKAEVGLGDVDNTSDQDKPVSTAVATALAAKAPSSHSHAIADVTGLAQALVDAGNSGGSSGGGDVTQAELATKVDKVIVPVPMAALVVDTTAHVLSSKDVAGNVALTFSADPVEGTVFGLSVTNASGGWVKVTLPEACYSESRRSAVSSVWIPAGRTLLSWTKTATGYDVLGDPSRRDESDKTSDPTGADDATEGFANGSEWVNKTAGRSWKCVDAVNGIWKRLDNVLQFNDHAQVPIVEVEAGKVYSVFSNVQFSGEVEKVTAKCETGTAVFAFAIDGSAFTEADVNVSSVQSTADYTVDNEFSVGSNLTFTASSVVACENVELAVHFKRSLV